MTALGDLWTHPDPASQQAGVLIAVLGLALLMLIQTARSRR